jgi:hypothetical protein
MGEDDVHDYPGHQWCGVSTDPGVSGMDVVGKGVPFIGGEEQRWNWNTQNSQWHNGNRDGRSN